MSNDQRVGDWMQTYSGRAFWPLDPRPEEIELDDIAHALSLQCRFGGHCRWFYSVAEHSIWCALAAVDPEETYEKCDSIFDAAGLMYSRIAQPAETTEQLVQKQIALAMLMHDAAEAYLVDLPRPIKRSMPSYSTYEAAVELAIWQRFNLPLIDYYTMKAIDNRLLATEAASIMNVPPMPWSIDAKPLPISKHRALRLFTNNEPEIVRTQFKQLFELLSDAVEVSREPTP